MLLTSSSNTHDQGDDVKVEMKYSLGLHKVLGMKCREPFII